MSDVVSALDYLRDARLALHATGAMPAWLWSADGSKILWANPTAAAILDASSLAEVTALRVDEAIASQISSLATTMSSGQPARLARLRGLPIGLGRALTCLCSRIAFAERSSVLLVVSIEQAGPHLTLEEQVRRLVAGSTAPLAFFSPDGKLLHKTAAAQMRLGAATTLAAFGAEELAAHALANGRASAGDVAIERVGNGASMVLMAVVGLRSAAIPKRRPCSRSKSVAAPAPELRTFAPPTATSLPDRAPTAAEIPVADGRRNPIHARLRGVRQHNRHAHASALGRPWHEITAALRLDPERKIARAIETRETWSAITIDWPIDDTNEHLPVELSGFPVFDREASSAAIVASACAATSRGWLS
jgi:hypothetical protein